MHCIPNARMDFALQNTVLMFGQRSPHALDKTVSEFVFSYEQRAMLNYVEEDMKVWFCQASSLVGHAQSLKNLVAGSILKSKEGMTRECTRIPTYIIRAQAK